MRSFLVDRTFHLGLQTWDGDSRWAFVTSVRCRIGAGQTDLVVSMKPVVLAKSNGQENLGGH